MPSKSREKQAKANGNGGNLSASRKSRTALLLIEDVEQRIDLTPRPYIIDPESAEEREKRLSKRKALTLKAFGIAYKNQQARKAS